MLLGDFNQKSLKLLSVKGLKYFEVLFTDRSNIHQWIFGHASNKYQIFLVLTSFYPVAASAYYQA
jgi:hypothetical protein